MNYFFSKLTALVLFVGISFSDWNPKYDDCFLNYSLESQQPIGVAVIAFNRPDYLKKTIESIEKNRQS